MRSTWSTNFADLTQAMDGMHEQNSISHTSDASLSLETANVNSGGKSIKDSGNLTTSDNLILNLDIRSLSGDDRIDLSDKTLSIEMYVPEEEQPYQFFNITLAGGGPTWTAITVRANMRPLGGWHTYKVDLSMLLELGSWQYFDWMHSPDITSREDAQALLRDIQWVQIGTIVTRQAGYASFLVDRLGWAPSGPPRSYYPAAGSLRKYADAKGLLLGAWTFFEGSSDPDFIRTELQQFSTGADQGEWELPTNRPTDSFTSFAAATKDTFLDNLSSRLGNGLERFMIYPAKTTIPQWLIDDANEQDSGAVTQDTVSLVRAEALRHKGKTKIWVMFNELLDYRIGSDPNYFHYTGLGLKNIAEPTDSSLPKIWENEYSPFSRDTSDLNTLVAAFQEARQVDPQAKLYITDYGEVKGDYRSDAVRNLGVALKNAGAPIDGVGLQCHVLIGADGRINGQFTYDEYVQRVAENVDAYNAAGLDVFFSEVDVPIALAGTDPSPAGQMKLAEQRQLQADVYRSLMHIALTHSNVKAYVMFGWPNTYTFIGQDPSQDALVGNYGDLGIFDEDWHPKIAYYALLDELKGSALPGPFVKGPADNRLAGPGATPTLSWTPSWNATSYEYCIDTTRNRTRDASWKSAGTATTVRLRAPLLRTTYYWQVRARNAAGYTEANGGAWGSFRF